MVWYWYLLVCPCIVVSRDDMVLFFFFKQKTAYEMRISDWSSDVCSSDRLRRRFRGGERSGAPVQEGDRRQPRPCGERRHRTRGGRRQTCGAPATPHLPRPVPAPSAGEAQQYARGRHAGDHHIGAPSPQSGPPSQLV